MFRSLTNAALAIAASLAIAAPVAADSLGTVGGDDLVIATIKYSDADLHSAERAKGLAMRIRVAADKVCGADDFRVRETYAFTICRQATIDKALKDLNAPLVANAFGRQTQPQSLARQ